MTNQSHWRTIAAPIVAKVIACTGTDDPKALRQALQEAYPFSERKFHPYRIWCDEIRRQLEGRTQYSRKPPPIAPGQISLLPPE